MLRAAVLGYLMLASAIGPSLCCCAVTSTVSGVRGLLGLGPVTCAGGIACSHSQPKPVASHDKHACHHGACPGHSKPCKHKGDSKTSQSQATLADSAEARPAEPTRQTPCPCKRDGNERPALPTSVLAAKSVLSTNVFALAASDWLHDSCSLDELMSADRPAVHRFRPHLLSGREILRALHILRC